MERIIYILAELTRKPRPASIFYENTITRRRKIRVGYFPLGKPTIVRDGGIAQGEKSNLAACLFRVRVRCQSSKIFVR
jgi:hypothetical protein